MSAQPATPLVETFESFYLREYRSVVALGYVLTGDHATAEDLAQEAFVAAYTSWAKVDRPAQWVRSAVSNKAMSWWRRSFAARRAEVRLYQPGSGVSHMPDESEAFWAIVRGLPRRQAQAIALYYLEDRSTQDVADTLGCSASTVRLHLSRARRALAERLETTE